MVLLLNALNNASAFKVVSRLNGYARSAKAYDEGGGQWKKVDVNH